LCSVGAFGAPAQLTFSATFPKPDGGTRAVEFAGAVDDARVSGQFILDGKPLIVSATIAERAVSGTFEANGRRMGRFWGKTVGRELQGHHDVAGEVGSWSIPLNQLPAALRGLLQ
jgi:hypothetical protein